MDARALKDKATEFFSKGKFAKSAEAYEAYCKADPKDLQARLRMGDAWAKSGKKDRAIVAYQAAAEGFARDGFLPRAIAASKLVLELDPAHKGIAQMLADLYARKSGSSRPSTARTLGAKPDPVAPTPTTRADAIEISVEEDVPAPPPPRAEPAVGQPDEGIEIELGSQPVTGEIEVPIVGVDLTPAPGELPAELDLPPPAAQSFELSVEEAPAAAPPLALDPPPAAAPSFALDLPAAAPPPTLDPTPAAAPSFELDPPVAAPPVKPAPPPAAAPSFELDPPAAAPPFERDPPPAAAPSFELEPPAAAPALEPAPPPSFELDPGAAPPLELARPPAVAPALARPHAGAPLGPSAPSRPPPEAVVVATEVTGGAPLEADDVVVLVKKPREGAPPASSPPGLRPRRADADEAPKSSSSGRIWLPPAFTAPAGTAGAVEPPLPAAGAPIGEASAKTELERSLERFAQFDADVSAPPVAAAQRAPFVAGFTELELEGDSLLQAVEAAAAAGAGAPRSSSSVSVSREELMEAPEELKPDPGALPKIPLFSDLPEDAFIALFERCPLRRAEPGDRIIDQGSQGSSFFVICAGKVRVLRADPSGTRELATLEEGTFFGEMALLSDAPRSASVEAAAEDTQLLEIPAAVLTELSAKHPTVATALKKFCRQRLLANLMNSASLFRPFTPTERRELVQRFRARDALAGEVLIQEGRPSDGLYVVLTGEVAVSMGDQQIATLREGQVFGEMSLLTRSPTSATVKTTRRTSFLRLPKEDFDQLIMSHPQILEQVAELTDERRRQNAALQARPNATAAMV